MAETLTFGINDLALTLTAPLWVVEEAQTESRRNNTDDLSVARYGQQILDVMFPVSDIWEDDQATRTMQAEAIHGAKQRIGFRALWLAHDFIGSLVDLTESAPLSEENPVAITSYHREKNNAFDLEATIRKPAAPCRQVRRAVSAWLAPLASELEVFKEKKDVVECRSAIARNLAFGGRGLNFHIGRISEICTPPDFDLGDSVIRLTGYDVKPFEAPLMYLAASVAFAHADRLLEAERLI